MNHAKINENTIKITFFKRLITLQKKIYVLHRPKSNTLIFKERPKKGTLKDQKA